MSKYGEKKQARKDRHLELAPKREQPIRDRCSAISSTKYIPHAPIAY